MRRHSGAEKNKKKGTKIGDRVKRRQLKTQGMEEWTNEGGRQFLTEVKDGGRKSELSAGGQRMDAFKDRLLGIIVYY